MAEELKTQTVFTRVQQKTDTALNWNLNNPVLLKGEIGIELDTGKMKVGNGEEAWNSLLYITGGGNSSDSEIAIFKVDKNRVVNDFNEVIPSFNPTDPQVLSAPLGLCLQDEKIGPEKLLIDFNSWLPSEEKEAALSAYLGRELKYNIDSLQGNVDNLQGSIDTLNIVTSDLAQNKVDTNSIVDFYGNSYPGSSVLSVYTLSNLVNTDQIIDADGNYTPQGTVLSGSAKESFINKNNRADLISSFDSISGTADNGASQAVSGYLGKMMQDNIDNKLDKYNDLIQLQTTNDFKNFMSSPTDNTKAVSAETFQNLLFASPVMFHEVHTGSMGNQPNDDAIMLARDGYDMNNRLQTVETFVLYGENNDGVLNTAGELIQAISDNKTTIDDLLVNKIGTDQIATGWGETGKVLSSELGNQLCDNISYMSSFFNNNWDSKVSSQNDLSNALYNKANADAIITPSYWPSYSYDGTYMYSDDQIIISKSYADQNYISSSNLAYPGSMNSYWGADSGIYDVAPSLGYLYDYYVPKGDIISDSSQLSNSNTNQVLSATLGYDFDNRLSQIEGALSTAHIDQYSLADDFTTTDKDKLNSAWTTIGSVRMGGTMHPVLAFTPSDDFLNKGTIKLDFEPELYRVYILSDIEGRELKQLCRFEGSSDGYIAEFLLDMDKYPISISEQIYIQVPEAQDISMVNLGSYNQYKIRVSMPIYVSDNETQNAPFTFMDFGWEGFNPEHSLSNLSGAIIYEAESFSANNPQKPNLKYIKQTASGNNGAVYHFAKLAESNYSYYDGISLMTWENFLPIGTQFEVWGKE